MASARCASVVHCASSSTGSRSSNRAPACITAGRLISQSPRYAQVMDSLHSAQSFASGLQRAGYATDPQYASKLSRAINTALNLQRAQA